MAVGNKSKSKLLRRKGYYGYFFILPLIIGTLLIFIPNIYHTFQYSVSTLEVTEKGYSATFSGFDEYVNAFKTDAYFTPYLVSNIKEFVINVPVIVIFATFISVLLNGEFKGRGIARIIFFIPVILSTGIISTVENSTDILNTVEAGRDVVASGSSSLAEGLSNLLMQINLPDFLMDVIESSISGIYNIVQQSGMQIFILLTALQDVPPSLYEAAMVEGCNKWESFWKITFPMIGPQIRVAAIYTIVDLTAKSDSVLMEYINRLAFRSNMFSLGTAMYMIYLACVLLIVLIVLGILNGLIKYNGES